MRIRSHRIDVKGLPLRNLLRILEEFPNATFRDSMIDVDLGVEEENTVVAPVTQAESAVEWGVDRHNDKLLGLDPAVDELVRALDQHPVVVGLRSEFKRKRDLNSAAGLAAAARVDQERTHLRELVRGVRDPEGDLHDIDVAEDIQETGGVEIESVILEWLMEAGVSGMNARQLADAVGLTPTQASGRLINLWENNFLRCEDEGENQGTAGRFFFIQKGE